MNALALWLAVVAAALSLGAALAWAGRISPSLPPGEAAVGMMLLRTATGFVTLLALAILTRLGVSVLPAVLAVGVSLLVGHDVGRRRLGGTQR